VSVSFRSAVVPIAGDGSGGVQEVVAGWGGGGGSVMSVERLARRDSMWRLLAVLAVDHFGERPACADDGVDPELFFLFPAEREKEARAKAVCAGCPVRPACLRFALRERVEGVWGGTTDAERRGLRTSSRSAGKVA
jgi:WhiB family redox-sensing transcriptional regulator